MTSRTSKKGIIIFILICTLYLLVGSCRKTEQAGTSERADKDIKQVASSEKTFQDAMAEMENRKAEIEKHKKNYNLSVKHSRSILDKREAEEAKKEIVRLSNALYELTVSALKNSEVIRHVSNAENTYEDYQNFALEILRQFNENN